MLANSDANHPAIVFAVGVGGGVGVDTENFCPSAEFFVTSSIIDGVSLQVLVFLSQIWVSLNSIAETP